MIDYKALAERINEYLRRLEAFTALNVAIEPSAFLDDLRTLVSLLEGMAEVPEGFALLPKMPSDEVWQEAESAFHRAGADTFRRPSDVRAIWREQISAAFRVFASAAPHPAPQPQPADTGFTLDQLADACMAAEIPDSKYESLCIALGEMERKATAQPQPERQLFDDELRSFATTPEQHEFVDRLIIWPEWFKEKYFGSLIFLPDTGALCSKGEFKTDGAWAELAEDVRRAIEWAEGPAKFVMVFLHECGGVTRCQIEQDRIAWSEPTGWRKTDGVEHSYCYGCSDVPSVDPEARG